MEESFCKERNQKDSQSPPSIDFDAGKFGATNFSSLSLFIIKSMNTKTQTP